jgi:hypothetical protein
MHLFPCAPKSVQCNNDISFQVRLSYSVNLDICYMMLIKPGAQDISSIPHYETAHFESQPQLFTTCALYDTKERQLQRVITMTYVCRNPKGGWNEGKFHRCLRDIKDISNNKARKSLAAKLMFPSICKKPDRRMQTEPLDSCWSPSQPVEVKQPRVPKTSHITWLI